MVSFFKKIKRKIIFVILWVNAELSKIIYKKKGVIFLLGTPWHGNMGDQAITLAENKFLHDNCRKKIIEIPSQYTVWYLEKWVKVIGNNSILIHGGGFIGSLWPEEDQMIKNVIFKFKHNKIVVFPQTIFFSENIEKEIAEYRMLFNKCDDITICVREKYSYDVSIQFKFPNVVLIPDMVLYLQSSYFNQEEYNENNTILLCLRNDKEKTFDVTILEKLFRKYPDLKYSYMDTYEEHTVYPYQRKRAVTKKINEFSKAKVLITDRLHGMIFSALAKRPCIVFSNCNYKIMGVYNWIANNENIKFMQETDDVIEVFDYMLKFQNNDYNNEKTIPYFDKLRKIIEVL